MTTSQKVAFSLLITVVLFGVFTALAFTGLFDLIETRFYDPAITSSITRDLTVNAGEIDKFLAETRNRFSETLSVPAVRRSFLPNQGAEDIFERSRIYGLLGESLRGFQGVRFIDSSGSRIHFSTFPSDIQQQDRLSVSYRNFNEPGYAYESIAVADNGTPVYTFDEKGDRILFSFPFYDSFDVYRGTALFSLSIKAVSDQLVSEGRMRIGQDLSVISDPKGLFSGMSLVGEKVLPIQVRTVWNEGWQETARLVSPSSGLSLALITVQTAQGFLVGRLVNEEIFLFPLPMKIILLVSFFLTVYLIIFLLFNLRQDSVTIIQNRLKQLQISLIEQFYERKGDVDWARWSRELEHRRDEISLQLKQGIKTTAVQDKDLDVLIDKSWDELLSVMGGRSASREAGIDEEKLQVILNRILAALPASGVSGAIPAAAPARLPDSVQGRPAAPVTEAEEVEEIEEAEEVEEVEELAAEEPAAEEPAEEAEPLDDIVTLEEEEPVEELDEEAETLEELEEEEAPVVAAAEEAEDLEEIEAAEAAAGTAAIAVELTGEEEAEPVEAEPLEDIVALEEAEEAEPLEELEELDEAEAPPEAAATASAEEPPEEAEPLEDIAALEEAEEAEPLEELEELDEAEAPPEAAATASAEEIVEWPPDDEEPVEIPEEAESIPEEEGEIKVPVIDVIEMNLSMAGADEVVRSISSGTDAEDLEELGDADEVEELEELDGEEPAPKKPAPANVADLASQIEFEPMTEPDTSGDFSLRDFEIVSPFSSMTFNFSDADDDLIFLEEEEVDESTLNMPASLVEEVSGSPGKLSDYYSSDTISGRKKKSSSAVNRTELISGLSLVSKPFFSSDNSDRVEILESIDEGEEDIPTIEAIDDDDDIIKEKEGVPYINGGVLGSSDNNNPAFNKDFKNLVDSVIK